MNDSEMYTVQEVARMLRVSRNFVYGLIQKNALPAIRVGRQLRVPKRDFEHWIMVRTAGPATEGS
jgi:excisionase family DNA binding protein